MKEIDLFFVFQVMLGVGIMAAIAIASPWIVRFYNRLVMSHETGERAGHSNGTASVHVPGPRTDTAAPTARSALADTGDETPDTDAADTGTDDGELPRVSRRLTDMDIVTLLAAQRGEHGVRYRFSANQIYELVKGSRKDVLDRVRAVREGPVEPVYPPRTPAQEAARAELGLEKVER